MGRAVFPEQTVDHLIRTKLNMPPLKAKMVERVHLLDRLSEGRDRPLIVITGVAGSGKTSLACQWIMREKLQVAWYSLDETDNESDLFFRYLSAALSTTDARLTPADSQWLQYRKKLVGRDVVLHLVKHFLRLSDDVYLVLDDYHFISSHDIHDALFYFLDHLPPKMHVVITSRYRIPFSVPHFRVRNQVVEISASDMRFTEQETERFFEQAIPVGFTTEEARAVAQRTEGWVGGLQLLGLSLKGKKTPDDLGAMLKKLEQDATDYLVDEVINVQSGKVRAFLETTALLDRFDVDLCREITGMPDAADVLSRIHKNNLFLIPLDGEGTWYRYHHLFSQALRERVRASAPARMVDVYRKAARWFARNSYMEDAFRNAFESGDFEFVADLMEDYLLSIRTDKHQQASDPRWLAKLPHEVFMERALLRLDDCGQKIETYQLSGVESVIRDVEVNYESALGRYESRKRKLCEDLFIYLKYALDCFYRNPACADVDRLDKASRMISPENRVFSGWLKILIASSHIYRSDAPPAENAIREARPLIFSYGSFYDKILWFRFMAIVEEIQGRLWRSRAVLQEASCMLDQEGLSTTSLRSPLYLPLSRVYYLQDDLPKALECATRVVEFGERTGLVSESIEGSLLLALAHLARGEREEADRSIQKMRRMAKEVGGNNITVPVEAWIARVSMARGDTDYAASWLDERKLSLEDPFSRWLMDESIVQGESTVGRDAILKPWISLKSCDVSALIAA